MGNIKTFEEFILEKSSKQRIYGKDNVFDLDKIPIEILDKGWKRYHPYTLNIDHRNPLANRVVESAGYEKQIKVVRDAILKTFPVSDEQFVIKEGHHKLFTAILVSLMDDNVDIIEQAMESKGFFRSQPTNDQILSDRKNRKWIDMRFEPKDPDDITEKIHRKYKVLYHLSPSIFEDRILKEGLHTTIEYSDYKYSDPRVYLIEGDSELDDIQEIVNTLYLQAQKRGIKELKPNYTLFTLDVKEMGYDIRFYYDKNEPKGIYSKVDISPKYIIKHENMKAQSDD